MAELNLQQITDRLNAEFTGDTRKLVFWYDDNADFADFREMDYYIEDCLNYQHGESISYLDGGKTEDKETFYHEILPGMLQNRKGWDVKSNREGGKGRPDITAFHLRKKEAYIIEVKYSKTEEELSADAKKAVCQINQMEYDKYFKARSPKRIHHYGIAFCREICKVLTE